MKFNSDVSFIIPTNLDSTNLSITSDNITFVKTDLHLLNKKIDIILGYHAKINSPYKLVDFKPMYGQLFSEYIENSDWWGYFDSDIIFGDISKFFTDEFLNKYDRIFTHGHLTLFRNNSNMNALWNKNFNLREVPNFKEVATSDAVFAFDEWGWGKNKGRGLSYALNHENKIRQYDNKDWFADLIKDKFKFNTTSGRLIEYFTYDKGKLIGFNDSSEINYLYIHFQKRTIINKNCSFNKPIYITPNIISNTKDYDTKEIERWKDDQKNRKLKQRKANFNLAYLKRRLRFLTSER